MGAGFVVLGQIVRDIALLVEDVPAAGETAPVRRREMLGGKGANQAVALAQLGADVALVGVVGDDEVGDRLLRQAVADGIDVTCVVRRPGTASGLIVDVVDARGRWRYLEDLPPPVLLTPGDVERALPALAAGATVLVQLQQPPAAALVAAEGASERGCRVLLDGAPGDPGTRERLLAAADIVRADTHEAGLLCGAEITSPEAAVDAGRALLQAGPSLAVLGAGDAGNVVVWDGGDAVLPLLDADVVDPTGAGDAFVAALAVELHRGRSPADAGRAASAAAAHTVTTLGGRPDLRRAL